MLAHERGKAQSRPIDLDDLTARLGDISADRQARPRPLSQTGSDYRSRDTTPEPLDEEEEYRYDLKRETKHYNTLISEGGRPSHPVSLGRDVLEHPDYREILSYWGGENKWEVFQSQMGEWRGFRNYQRSNRGEGRFLAYIDAVKRSLARHGFTRPVELAEDLDRQDKLTTWIEFLDFEHWFYDKDIRIVKRLQPGYDEAWKELVDSHVLKPNETEEFICNIDSVFQHSSETERAEKAVKSAEAAVMSAQQAITDPRRSSLPQREPQRRLAAAQSRLDAAAKTLESIKRRNGLVDEFYKKTQLSQITKDGKRKRSYQMAKKDAERRSILLRWILQQIPLIELELRQANVAENATDRASGRSCDGATELSEEQKPEKQERKHSRHDDTVDEELPSKRPRYDGQGSSFSTRKTPRIADAIPTERSQNSRTAASRGVRGRKLASGKPELTTGERCGVKSNWSTVNSSQPGKTTSPDVPPEPKIPNRRSARIADKRVRTAVVAPSDTIRNPGQKTAKLTQAPTSPSSTESHERKLRFRARMTSKRGRPKGSDKRVV